MTNAKARKILGFCWDDLDENDPDFAAKEKELEELEEDEEEDEFLRTH